MGYGHGVPLPLFGPSPLEGQRRHGRAPMVPSGPETSPGTRSRAGLQYSNRLRKETRGRKTTLACRICPAVFGRQRNIWPRMIGPPTAKKSTWSCVEGGLALPLLLFPAVSQCAADTRQGSQARWKTAKLRDSARSGTSAVFLHLAECQPKRARLTEYRGGTPPGPVSRPVPPAQ